MRTIYKPIEFPRDGKEHPHAVEWWYFNGHLKDDKGNRYAFMDTFFKIHISKIGVPFSKTAPFKHFYFAHSIVSDITKKKSHADIKNLVIVSQDSFSKPLLFINYADPIIFDGYENSEIEETKLFNYHIKNGNLDLKLKSVKNPMLEGGKGFNDMCGLKSFYYSLTDMKASGTIRINGKDIKVFGKAWMDHQWTNTVSKHNDRWNWFSIQLDNNIEMMCVEYISGNKKDYLVDIFYSDGSHESFNKLKLTPSGIWKSKNTKVKYPLKWQLEIPEKSRKGKIKLDISALINDQEMKAGLAKYWEGPIEVKGEFDGKKVKGLGFMELVAHAMPYGIYSIEEVKKIVKKIL